MAIEDTSSEDAQTTCSERPDPGIKCRLICKDLETGDGLAHKFGTSEIRNHQRWQWFGITEPYTRSHPSCLVYAMAHVDSL